MRTKKTPKKTNRQPVRLKSLDAILKTMNRFHEAEQVACWLHNNSAAIVGNTEQSDAEWFARTLYQRSANFGSFEARGFFSHITNEDFQRLGLVPDRPWTGKRWESLAEVQRAAWIKMACVCLSVLPELCERIGHRGMEQAKAIHQYADTLKKSANGAHQQPPPTTPK